MYRRQQLQKLQELRGTNLAAPTTVTAGPTQITGNTRTFITSCANKVKHEPQQVHNYTRPTRTLCALLTRRLCISKSTHLVVVKLIWHAKHTILFTLVIVTRQS